MIAISSLHVFIRIRRHSTAFYRGNLRKLAGIVAALECYKVIVTMNGLSSDPEQTTAERILTKPVLKALRMSADTVALTKDAKQEFKIVPIPVVLIADRIVYTFRQKLFSVIYRNILR